eukprot:Mycagemm_TRINITY_DN10139_c0_g1::TRINITY_DN10139_c0_g1_i1::g.5264::m.5264 type:complete len:142 gc:universal TRINITY_DN10139_c0_g1_i1:1573-1998(+)
MCEVLDCSGDCANITEFTPTPQVGDQDTHYLINCAVNVTQAAGTGMIQFLLYPEGDIAKAMANSILMYTWTPGYLTFSIELIPSEMGLPPGNWSINLSACEGECGSKHEHSSIFSSVTTWLYWNKDTHKPYPVHRLPVPRR